jgi:tetratricopeptide (TPR) repeat protein
MAKKKVDIKPDPEIQPDDTSPVIVDPLHEGKTLQVPITPQNTRPIPEYQKSLDETQAVRHEYPASDLGETIHINPPTSPIPSGKPKQWIWILIGVVIVLVGAGIGSFIGYSAAVKARVAEQDSKVALVTTSQFQLAELDIAEGRLNTARQRLEYIIQINPGFPGASEKLTAVMLAQASIATPTAFVDVPTPVPTKDTRNTEEIFTQARLQAANNEWNAVIESLDALRQIDRTFRVVQVDGLYATALRNRGIIRINSGKLEQGIYDITIAGLYGPVDKDAISSANTARYYLAGAAAWGVDWPKVLEFFASFYATAPGLRDASGMTAGERYRLGNILYADQLMAEEKACDAAYYYQVALSISSDDLTANKFNDATNKCAPPTEEAPPTVEIPKQETVAPTESTPEATVEPTIEGTP